MSVSIHFAQRQNVFTNLDTVSGKVLLFLTREESFSAINVKLEGEARTRLAHPLGTRSGDRGETELEVHKLLYSVATVFPTTPVLGAKAYTLQAGQHEFPFSFKIPFNNACNPNNIKRLKMVGGIQMDVRDQNRHIKRTLPPSLSGLPGQAEIKYFVKVTAERPAFYKENYRAVVPFKFLPIEPPRPPPNTRETYGRRKHQFSPHSGLVAKAGSFWPSSNKNMAPDNAIPPLVSVEARLPDPAIITCNEPLPLRVLVTKLNDSPESVFLRTFHVMLWGHTRITAHMLERTEVASWVLCSYANMSVELKPSGSGGGGAGSKDDDDDKTTPEAAGAASEPIQLDKKLWASSPLPLSVPPSFEACNLSRWYELEVSVGLSWGRKGRVRPELTVQPIRLAVSVYSGIAPSPALISAAANAAAAANSRPPTTAGAGAAGTTTTTSSRPPANPAAAANAAFPPPQPPRPGAAGPAAAGPGAAAGAAGELDPGAAGPSSAQAQAEPAPAYDEPPPSYEDAMAEDLAPVDGPRRDYQVLDSAPVTDGRRRNS